MGLGKSGSWDSAPLAHDVGTPVREKKVLEKSYKFFSILKNGKPSNVSIDRLKPAFLTVDMKEVVKEQVAPKKPGRDNVDNVDIQYSDLFEHNDFPPLTTRYGRLSKRPVRFQS